MTKRRGGGGGGDCMKACSCCPHVGQFCCCDLRTGAIIIATVLLVWGLVDLLLFGLLYGFVYYPFIVNLVICILMIITGILLLIGVLQGENVLVKVSLILLLIIIIFYAILLILVIVELAQTNASGLVLLLVIIILLLALLIYFFIVLLSYYQ